MEINKVRKIISEIEKDCLKLKRKNDLTEYGEGQLDLIRILKGQ